MADEYSNAFSSRFDVTFERFLRRVCDEHRDRLAVVEIRLSDEVWNMVAHETNFGTTPGTRMTDELEIRYSRGWVPILAGRGIEGGYAVYVTDSGPGRISLDFDEV